MTFALALVAMTMVGPARSLAVDYDEGIDGDLSGTPASTTSLGTLGVGANNLAGTFGGGDFDLLTLSIASGQQLQSIVLNDYSGPALSFVGLQNGTSWTEGTGSAIDPANLLGWTHFSMSMISSDILDDIGVGFSATGFVPPLPLGDYTFLLQDTGLSTLSYSMTFNVVPEPSSILLAVCGFASLIVLVRRPRVRNC